MDKNLKENYKQINFENFNQTTEEDVGIIEFVNKEDEGFECILKHRYSDFIVNEISENGKVVWLKDPNKKQESVIQREEIKDIKKEENVEHKKEIIEDKNTENYQVDKENPSKGKFILKTQLVEEIINNHFVEKQILDKEDGEKLRELIIKYNERHILYLF